MLIGVLSTLTARIANVTVAWNRLNVHFQMYFWSVEQCFQSALFWWTVDLENNNKNPQSLYNMEPVPLHPNPSV